MLPVCLFSLNNRPLVIQGLVILANTLLGVGSVLGRDGDLIAIRQWEIGKMIIIKVIKKKRRIAPVVITSLSNRIVTGQNVYQYIGKTLTVTKHLTKILFQSAFTCYVNKCH